MKFCLKLGIGNKAVNMVLSTHSETHSDIIIGIFESFQSFSIFKLNGFEDIDSSK